MTTKCVDIRKVFQHSRPVMNASITELRNAHDTIKGIVAKYIEDRNLLGRNLNGSVLDGTPYAIVRLESGNELVYGEWTGFLASGTPYGGKTVGFLDFRVVPAGLCGAYLYDLEDVNKRLKILSGHFVAVHRRELERRQLDYTESQIRTLSATLAEIALKLKNLGETV